MDLELTLTGNWMKVDKMNAKLTEMEEKVCKAIWAIRIRLENLKAKVKKAGKQYAFAGSLSGSN